MSACRLFWLQSVLETSGEGGERTGTARILCLCDRYVLVSNPHILSHPDRAEIAPDADKYVPAAQSVHAESPAPLEYVPA